MAIGGEVEKGTSALCQYPPISGSLDRRLTTRLTVSSARDGCFAAPDTIARRHRFLPEFLLRVGHAGHSCTRCPIAPVDPSSSDDMAKYCTVNHCCHTLVLAPRRSNGQ